MSIKENLSNIKDKVNSARIKTGSEKKTKIIAVTKTHSPEKIASCIEAGILSIGENKIQEAQKKFKKINFPNSFEKHFIGHLQTNKINKCLTLFDFIDSVDSFRLSSLINKKAENIDKKIPVLLEINICKEERKKGFFPDQIEEMLKCFENQNILIKGVMTIGPSKGNNKKKREAFQKTRRVFLKLNEQRPSGYPQLTELSMGMSNDYEIAIEEGSTQVRIGTALLGKRL